MFGKGNNWTDKLKDKLTAYVDERFEDYKERLAEDLSKGIATLAGLVLIWTVAVIGVIFVGIAMSLLLAELFRPWLANWAYLLGFLVVAMAIGALGYWLIKNKVQYVEKPVYLDILKSLGGILPEEPEPVAEPLAETKQDVLPPIPLKTSNKGAFEEKKDE